MDAQINRRPSKTFVSIYIDVNTLDELEKYANKEDMSRSSTIVKFIKLGLKKEKSD